MFLFYFINKLQMKCKFNIKFIYFYTFSFVLKYRTMWFPFSNVTQQQIYLHATFLYGSWQFTQSHIISRLWSEHSAIDRQDYLNIFKIYVNSLESATLFCINRILFFKFKSPQNLNVWMKIHYHTNQKKKEENFV